MISGGLGSGGSGSSSVRQLSMQNTAGLILERHSDGGIEAELLAKVTSAATTPSSEQASIMEQNLLDLDFYYTMVKRHLLKYQSPTSGLYPVCSADTRVGSVRVTIYCSMSLWTLSQAYKKVDDDQGKAYELAHCTISGMQGILACWMRQSHRLEAFKAKQSPEHALHVLFELDTGFEVFPVTEYGHLQIDVVSLYLLFLVQAIASGLQIISTMEEVAFVQNLVFYVERAYRTPDFGMWERGSTYNNGTCEVNASSIGMAKAALESINGFNLFGANGASWSVVYVDIDAHNRNRSIFETLLPRESASKECDAALLPIVSFPAFATHDEPLYRDTLHRVVEKLQGQWGFKRFDRDGYGCVLEPKDRQYYPEGATQKFEGVESEWPIFHTFMIIDGVFKSNDVQIENHQRWLKQLLKYTEKGDPILPMYYYVPAESLSDERGGHGSQYRYPSEEGGSSSNIFLWGQAMLIIADLMASQLVQVHEVDPIRRYLPSSSRPKAGGRYSTFEISPHDSVVQVVLIAESRRLQASLNTFGIVTQTPEEIEPVQIWSQMSMVKVFERLGQSKKLALTGRPDRPIGALGTSKLYRVCGQTVMCYPLIFSATEFYISHDLALLTDNIRTDINFVSKRWRLRGRPTVCIIITEDNMKDPQFPDLLSLLTEIRSLRVDNVKISLGRLQNLITSACLEHLDFSNRMKLADLEIEQFVQLQHKHMGYTSLIEVPKMMHKQEELKDFRTEFINWSDEDIKKEIENCTHLYKTIQLLGILLHRHGEDYPIDSFTVKERLEDLNKRVGAMRYWAAVRYSSSLLRQMIDSISPYVTQILVNGKQVTVGIIGEENTLFDKPMTPADCQKAIYTKVQPFSIISAVLQQELILYCGKLIATHPELFSGILVVRIGWVLRALELYRAMTEDDPEPLECCSPHALRQLVHTVMSESRAINLNFDWTPNNGEKSKQQEEVGTGGGGGNPCTSKETRLSSGKKLSVYDVRQLSGCLVRVPDNFYSNIWHILKKTEGGIHIQDKHLPQEPTCSKMASTELSFGHIVENMLNGYNDPVYKQMVIEFFSVLAKIMNRHPEMLLIENLHVESLIDQAMNMYAEDRNVPGTESRKLFFRDTVAHTSAYLGKAIIMNLLDGKSLSRFAVSAAASEFHCHLQ